MLLSVVGSTCISQGTITVGRFSTPGSITAPSDLITASLSKFSIVRSLGQLLLSLLGVKKRGKKEKKIALVSCIYYSLDFIYYYSQILIVLFLEVGSVISGDGRGERWVPHTFFFLSRQCLFRGNSSEANETMERKIMQICFSSVTAPFVSAVCPVIAVLQPNFDDMLTIAQGTCTLHFVTLSCPFLLFGCFEVVVVVQK